MNSEFLTEYYTPVPLLHYGISRSMLHQCWDQLSLGPEGLDSQATVTALYLVALIAEVIGWTGLREDAEFDAALFMSDAAMGINMPENDER